MNSVEMAGVRFDGLTRESVLDRARREFIFVATVNAEFVVRANEEPWFGAILSRTVNVLDGQIPFLAAKRAFPGMEIEKIPGCEFVHDMCKLAVSQNWGVFLLGGRPDSNAKAVEVLRRQHGCRAAGYSPAMAPLPFAPEVESEVRRQLEDFGPKVILVGFGAGKQERWIEDHRPLLESLGLRIACGVGGTFEFLSGTIPRAPKILQSLGLEGVYRLIKEPKWFRLKRLVLSLQFFRYLWSRPRRILHDGVEAGNV